jgi:predicted dehydrogenase
MSYETGLVGLSGIGTRHQVGYAATEGIDLVAIADVDDELLARHGDAWDIPEERRYADHAELLAAEDLDAVSIATPSFLHHEHVLDAVDSAADPDVVWCEKPIAVSVSEAYEMLAACEESDVDLLIDHTRRFSETYRRLHEAINEAEVLGEVQSVHVQSPEELLRNGTHMVDLLTYLLDERFERVMGHLTDAGGGDLDDSGGGGVAITESGTYVNVDATTSREITTGDWLVVGDEGKLEFSEYAGEIGYWRLEDSDEGSYGTEHVEAPLPEPVDGFDDSEAMFAAGAANVVGLLDGTAENRSPGEEATHVLETIVGLFVSHYTGSAVDLPLDRPLQDVSIRSQ